jgi:eukaryotic-like serine/threonine-protein kinase
MQNEIVEGRVLAGKYRIERVLGRGGMGVVVAAHHIQLDEKVAIKFLLPEAVSNAEVVGRFVREARAAVRIKSEHVARVTDVGTLEGGEPYMVMEYLEGSDLAGWLQQRGALPVEQAVEFVIQACEAIAEAHALGIVHRDLKPANLFVVRRADGLWSVKVLDFGISKVTAPAGSGSDANFTRTAAVMGSPLYMPPEQMAASKLVDARADIWALGVILYELIAGQAPFAGDTLPEVCMKIALEAPRPIGNFRPGVPQALQAVISRCLEKDRERRYSNVAELAHALLEFAPPRARNSVERITRTIQAAGLPSSALAPPASFSSGPIASGTGEGMPMAVAHSAAGTGTEAPWGRTAGVPSHRKRTALVVSSLVFVASVGLAFGVKRWFFSPAPTSLSSAQATPGPAEPSASAAPLILPVRDTPAPALASAAPSASQPEAVIVPSARPAPPVAPPASAFVTHKHPPASVVIAPVQKHAPPSNIFDDR